MDKALVEPYMSPLKPLPTDLSPQGSLRSRVNCLLCDIYGTLFVSGCGDISIAQQEERQSQGIEELLAKYHLNISPSALVRSLYKSIQDEHHLAKKQGVDYPEVQIDGIWSNILPFKGKAMVRSFAVEFEMIMNPVWPMPGLMDLIKTCRKNEIRLGIISNAQFFTPYLFDWYLGKDLPTLGFDPQLTFYSYKHGWAKPSCFLFQLAVEKLEQIGITAAQVAYIGNDRRNDMAPAQDVGFQTVLFAGDARSLRMREDDPVCQHVAPDLTITHLDQLAWYLLKMST